jgi:K+ transporter
MNQTIKHSQMPKFVKNPSCTNPHLYQHPTAANTVQYKSKSGLVRASIAAIICSVSIISGLFSCTVDQHATAAQIAQIKAGVKP